MLVKILFLFIAFIFTIKIWSVPGVNKLKWFFAGILFFPQSIILVDTPNIPFQRYIALVLFLTVILKEKNIIHKFQSFPLKNGLILILFSMFLIGVFNDSVGIATRMFRFVFTFIEMFSILFLSSVYIKNIFDAVYVYRFLVKFFVIFAIYGLFNFLLKENIYGKILASVYHLTDTSNAYNAAGTERFRISSFTWHPIYYGFLLGIMILLIIYLMNIKNTIRIFRNSKFYLILLLLIINLFLTNSRTPLICIMVGISIYILTTYSLKGKLRIFLYGVLFFVGVLIVKPNSFGIVGETFNTFSEKGSNLEGSSVEMRNVQLAASVAMFYKKPIFGHGFSFIVDGLGFGGVSGADNKSDQDFAGFESYGYKLLIEQGLAGMMSNLFLFVSIFMFSIKRLKKVNLLGRKTIFLSLSMTVAFVLFVFGTGDMGTFLFFMSLLGVNIKLITLCVETSNKNLETSVLNENLKFA